MTHPNHVHPRHKRTAAPAPYRPLFKRVEPVVKSNARKAHTYCGARRNAERFPSRAELAKAHRQALGMTRREFDRMRWLAEQAA